MRQYNMNQVPHGGQQQMQPGGADPAAHQQQLHELCQAYNNHLVQFETNDGQVYDGIIDGMDQNGVDMLVPVGDMDQGSNHEYERQFGFGGYGGGYGYPRRFRRFRRHRFPFFGIRRLFFPFFF
ncbi:hypothetical protein [Alteribacter populi]|uniref:hypothetical protein n=1 Tax=Alteribacter populi TaxID=2011011 RepID=UPI000BBA4887|nr:hypothetical protein [Alteribacter populi]